MVYATYQCVNNEIRPFLEELEDADSAHAQMGAASKPTEAEDASTVFDESDSQEQHDPRRPATTPTEAPSSTFSKRADGVPQHYRRHSPARGMVIGDREVEPSLLTQRAHSDGEAAVDPSLHLYDRGTEIFGALSLRLRPRHPRRVRRTGDAPGGIYARRGIGGKPKATPTDDDSPSAPSVLGTI